MDNYDVAIIGGGPSGATAAFELAGRGLAVLLIDRDGRIKPCGGAVPPILLREFDIPDYLLECRVTSARMVSPADKRVDMDIGGFVGMVDRGKFDPWLRERAAAAGATRVTGYFEEVARDAKGGLLVRYRDGGKQGDLKTAAVKSVVGADGAASKVRKQVFDKQEKMKHVFAYHEIVRSPDGCTPEFDPERCDVYYQGIVPTSTAGYFRTAIAPASGLVPPSRASRCARP